MQKTCCGGATMTTEAMVAKQVRPFRYEIECRMEGEHDWIPLIGAISSQDALDQISLLIMMDRKHQPANAYGYRVMDRMAGRVVQKAHKNLNPVSGKDATAPDRRMMTFNCSGKLKDRVNG
jgi:hypothetical protein